MKTMSRVTVSAVVFGLSVFGLPDADGMLATPAAQAKNEKGDRGNNGRGHGAGGRSGAEVADRGLGRADKAMDLEPRGRGHIARELKSMNAANAFKNGNVPNASASSNVGRIAAYREALAGNQALIDEFGAPEDLDAAMTDALNELAANGVDLSSIDDVNTVESLSADRVAELQGAIDALDVNSPTYSDDKALLEGQIAAVDAAVTSYSGAQTDLASLESGMLDASASFEAASGGRPKESFSEKALEAFHDLLGIDN